MNADKPKNLYQRAGIHDTAEFYRQRYTSDELLNAEYFDEINRFDLRWARTMWVYDNVRRGARVLDLGCGSGVLALLKRKDVTLYGVDLAPECAGVARRNGYDFACAADLTKLPFQDQSFDYVISLDVMGHVEFEFKDAAIAEMKRVLKADGVTMHGIEILNRERRKDYDQMSEDELKKFIEIDGHVGMEAEHRVRNRFERVFQSVTAEPRFSICQSAEELVKQADEYGAKLADQDFLDYLRGLPFAERRAFNMAMGFVFQQVSDLNVKLPASEYLFLKAANVPLGSFYNEHRDREDFQSLERSDSDSQAHFESGWYAAEMFPPVARWMAREGTIRFRASALSRVSADVMSHIPDLEQRPLQIDFVLNDVHIRQILITHNGWQKVEIDLAPKQIHDSITEFVLEIRADRTWQPRSTEPTSTDSRELSIVVSNLQIR